MRAILSMMLMQQPCCGCCNGDDNYFEIVAQAFAMTIDTEWPDIDEILLKLYGKDWGWYQSRLLKSIERIRKS